MPTFKVKHFSALCHEAFAVTEFNKICWGRQLHQGMEVLQ
jgi:hypothetical protein